jgi:Ca2+-transporting ATPase
MFVTGMLRGEPLLLMLLTAISLAVAAIPEALPAVVTVSLALGARKLVSQNALIRKLPAVETLGSVTFICSDKTGTLTENRMRVEEVYADAQALRSLPADAATREPWRTLLAGLALSNDARPTTGEDVIGDPTEVALYLAARQAGADKAALSKSQPRLAEIAFDSERARMTTLHREDDGVIAFTKGAPEHVLPLCHDRLVTAGVEVLDRGAVEEVVERMAADGLRVLAVAFRRWPAPPEPFEAENVETRLTFAGLVGLLDPPRAEAREAVQLCRTAGITPVMITGDHPATARAIAARLGIIADDGEVITGRELARLDMAQFKEHVERVRVYARVAPEQKIKIVQALQDRGEYVAMTGDGVNDAPALKRADIGVAMGITGTDVAKEAGHMILLDDNFASIVAAVREGRRIFDNIRKFVRFVMTGNSGEIGTLFLAPFLGLPLPLLPIHILWVNLVTDGLPGLALAAEPQEQGIMQRPPRPPRESLFAHGIWQHILWVGGLITALCLVTQAWALHVGDAHWQTMVFTVLTLSQMTHVLAIRSETESLFTRGFTTNLPLLGAVLLTFVLQLATIYVPVLNPIFRTQPLTAVELGICLMLAATVFVAVEIEKWLVRRGVLYHN